MMRRSLQMVFVALMVLVVTAAPGWAEPTGKLMIFHAGSLSVPFKAMKQAFETKYPQVDVQFQAGGSTKVARMISEQGKSADIMASADYAVIDKTLIPAHADVNIRFATNQLVLCYTDKSRYASEINADNWYEILQRKDVVWGHSDPNLDPCGYRSLMVLQLAEAFYQKPGLNQALLDNRPQENVRPKAVELLSLLQSGDMDYAWEYLSVAVQHHLNYVVLNEHINLSNYAFDPFYARAKVEVSGKKPGTTIVRTGKSCTYGVTLIKNAQNPEAAEAFMEYLLSPEGGLKILKDMGQPPFVPARVSDAAMQGKLPEGLRPLVEIRP